MNNKPRPGTVKDLIEALQAIPPDTNVTVVETFELFGSPEIEFVGFDEDQHFWYTPSTNTVEIGVII